LTQRSTTVVETQVPVVESRTEPTVSAAAEEPAAAQGEEEAVAEAGLVDIASILGAPTVTVVRSSFVGHTPRVLMQGRKKSRRRTPSRIPLYSY
jgi:hypothetical protein